MHLSFSPNAILSMRRLYINLINNTQCSSSVLQLHANLRFIESCWKGLKRSIFEGVSTARILSSEPTAHLPASVELLQEAFHDLLEGRELCYPHRHYPLWGRGKGLSTSPRQRDIIRINCAGIRSRPYQHRLQWSRTGWKAKKKTPFRTPKMYCGHAYIFAMHTPWTRKKAV